MGSQKLGKIIKKARKNAGLTQEENPTRDVLQGIGKVLKMKPFTCEILHQICYYIRA